MPQPPIEAKQCVSHYPVWNEYLLHVSWDMTLYYYMGSRLYREYACMVWVKRYILQSDMTLSGTHCTKFLFSNSTCTLQIQMIFRLIKYEEVRPMASPCMGCGCVTWHHKCNPLGAWSGVVLVTLHQSSGSK